MRETTYKVEGDCEHSYTQTTDKPPRICGVCGSSIIRVWAIEYDAWSPVLAERIAALAKHGS